MQSEVEPRLLDFFLVFWKLESLDNLTKAALRLCTEQIKAAIDATVIACTVKSADLDHLLSSKWHLSELIIDNNLRKQPSPEFLKFSFTALLGKFPLLKNLNASSCRLARKHRGALAS